MKHHGQSGYRVSQKGISWSVKVSIVGVCLFNDTPFKVIAGVVGVEATVITISCNTSTYIGINRLINQSINQSKSFINVSHSLKNALPVGRLYNKIQAKMTE